MSTDDVLELPPADGEAEGEEPLAMPPDVLDVPEDDDPYDDELTDDPVDLGEMATTLEASALGDDEDGFAIEADEPPDIAESESLVDNDDEVGVGIEDFGIGGEETVSLRDAGEEGFEAPEPELRVEDLPKLDEGDDDELSIEEASDLARPEGLMRFDDRSFDREIFHALGHVVALRQRTGLEVLLADGTALRSVDGGKTFSAADEFEPDEEAILERGLARALLREGVGVLRALGDAPLVALESTAGATAFTLLEDGAIMAGIHDDEARDLLVIVGADGITTVVADVGAECDEEAPSASPTVEAVVADDLHVWVGGAFGLFAFRRR